MADHRYEYSRQVVNCSYNIDNAAKVDGEGNPIHLAKLVEAAIPGEKFVLRCNGPLAVFIFENKLTVGQQTTLTNIVTTYKA